MSPSSISLMRAPASRISATRSSCRGRSSTIAVMSPTWRPNASAIATRFSPTGRRRSIRPLATGPTAIFFMYMRGSGVRPPGSDAARIESAPWRPPATAAPFPIGSQARSSGRPAAAQLAPLRERVALVVAADHEPARDGHPRERVHHRLGRRPVGRLRVAAAEVAARGEHTALCHRGQLGAAARLDLRRVDRHCGHGVGVGMHAVRVSRPGGRWRVPGSDP